MKLDWSHDGWRVFPDSIRFSGQEPERVIQHDIRVGVVELRLGKGQEQNKGWVYIPDGTPLEVITCR